jgi:hypothetical protein
MESQANFNVISKIISIELSEFKLNKKSLKGLDVKSIVFDHTITFRIESASKHFLVDTNTKFYNDKSKSITLGHINSKGKYEIVNLSEVLSLFSGKVPQNVNVLFIDTQLSTVRGFFILKTKDTYLDGAIIPIVNLNLSLPEITPNK